MWASNIGTESLVYSVNWNVKKNKHRGVDIVLFY